MFQLAILVFTTLRLQYEESNEESKEVPSVSQLFGGITVMGAVLSDWAGERTWIDYARPAAVLCIYITGKFLFGWKKETCTQTQNSNIILIIMRNLLLFVTLEAFVTYLDLRYGPLGYDCDDLLFHVDEYVSDWDFFFIKEALGSHVLDFIRHWRVFHPPHLWLLRLSHAFLYPPILLCLTQRDLKAFFIWFIFLVGIDLNHTTADIVHMVTDPELAMTRLEYEDSETAVCYVDAHAILRMISYPLNFVYLTTPWGYP